MANWIKRQRQYDLASSMPTNAVYPVSTPPMLWVSGGTGHLKLYGLESVEGSAVEIPLPSGLWPRASVLVGLYGGPSARALVRPEGRVSVLGLAPGVVAYGVVNWPIGGA